MARDGNTIRAVRSGRTLHGACRPRLDRWRPWFGPVRRRLSWTGAVRNSDDEASPPGAARPSDVSDEEWPPASPNPTRLRADAGLRGGCVREASADAALRLNRRRNIGKTGAPYRWGPAAPADADDRAQVERLVATGESADLASIGEGCTGDEPVKTASAHGIGQAVVERPDVERGLVLPLQSLSAAEPSPDASPETEPVAQAGGSVGAWGLGACGGEQ